MDSPFTEFARTPLGSGLVIGISVVAFTGTFFVVSRRGRPDTWSLIGAAVTGAAFVALLNAFLGSTGIWRSTDYTLPVAVLGSFFVLLTALLIWVLMLYRWLWRQRSGRIASGGLLGLLAVLTVVGDRFALERHYVAFGNGYSIWIDAVVAVLTVTVPVLAYELARNVGLDRAVGRRMAGRRP